MADVESEKNATISAISTICCTPPPSRRPSLTKPLELLETTAAIQSQPFQHNEQLHTDQDIPEVTYSTLRQLSIIAQLSGINLCSSASHGLVVISLPTIATELSLPPSLALWPISSTCLGTAATLLLAGVLADTLGPRVIDLVGCLMISAFMFGSAFASNGAEMVAMRAIQGVGIALHFSSSVALVVQAFPKGRRRNLAFASLGLSQPLGFAIGLVIGGLLLRVTGWRMAWFIVSGICMALFLVGLWVLPRTKDGMGVVRRIKVCGNKTDWIGALIASGFMAVSCYLLAIISANTQNIRNIDTIILLCIAIALIPCFMYWMHRQTSSSRPALIPNSFWRNSSFTAICLITALSFCAVNAIELFSSLYFQEVQHLDGIQASIRIVPSLLVGVLIGLCCGLLVDRFRAVWLIGISSAITALSPLIMANIPPEWSYWQGAFEAQLLCPVAADILFTVGLSIISDVFPDDTQALAGAVFNTSSQFGTALGLAVLQIVSQSVAEKHGGELLMGYRDSFWCLFGFMMACVVISRLGLCGVGRVGVKQLTRGEDSESGLVQADDDRI